MFFTYYLSFLCIAGRCGSPWAGQWKWSFTYITGMKRNHTTCVFVQSLTNWLQYNSHHSDIYMSIEHMFSYDKYTCRAHDKLPHYGHKATFTSPLALHDLNFLRKPSDRHKYWYKTNSQQQNSHLIMQKIACLQLDSLCLNLVVSAFVSFSVTCTLLDYMTMSWWLIKWRTWRTKSSRSRMPLSVKWNRRTLKWLYVMSPSHTLVMSLSDTFFFSFFS